MTTKVAKRSSVTVLPNGNRLFIRPIIEDAMSEGGIYLPPQVQQAREVRRAEVVKVGPGMYTADGKRIPMPFKPGDIILYPRFCGNEVEIDKQTYLIVTEPDVLGVEARG